MAETRPLLAAIRPRPTLTAGLVLLAAVLATVLAAPLLAPADPDEIFGSGEGKFLPPGSERSVVRLVNQRSLLSTRTAWEGGLLVLERQGRREVYPAAEVAVPRPGEPAPRRRFPLGTDSLGRDLASRVLFGGRISLAIGALAALLAIVAGVAVGSAAAAGGPLVDAVLMRTVDAALAIPRFFIALTLVALLDPGPTAIVVILGGIGWMSTSRLLRAELIALADRDFVVAARALGAGRARILARHLLPNALTPVLVQAGLLVGDAILAESTLSFLGQGISPPTATWGNLMADGRDYLTHAWWMAAFPGVALAATVLGLHLIVDGLRDVADPRG